MHIKLTPTIVRRQAEADASVKGLIERLVYAEGEDLIQIMHMYTSRSDRPRGDLCPWVPVLDKFDSMLESHVDKYQLYENYPEPTVVKPSEEHMIVEILQFTVFLLEKCSNRSIYGSIAHLLCMLKSTSTSITASAITVLSKLPPRIAQTRSGAGRTTVASSYEAHVRALITLLPITGQESIGSSQTSSLITFVDKKHNWSDNWSTVRIHYYPPPVTPRRTFSALTPTRPSAGESSSSDHSHGNKSASTDLLQSFFIDADEVRHSSFEELLSKACKKLPKTSWYEAINKIRLAKSCQNTEEGLVLREMLVKIQLRALVFFSLTFGPDRTSNSVFNESPDLLKQVGDLLAVDSSVNISISSRIFALETLLEISQQSDRRSEIVTVLSANVSHGILMSAVRALARDLRAGSPIDEEYSTLLLMLLSSLSSYQQVGSFLSSAGLLSLLLDLIQIESTPYVRTMASVVELLDHLIIDIPATFPQFLEIGGVKILIETARKEISYCISNNRPDENLPGFCSVDYELSYYRTQWIRSLFVVISNVLIQTRNTQSLQNIVDSSLLSVSSDVITHPDLFGCRILSLNLQIIANMLEHESTAFGIMKESGLIDLLMDNLSSMLKRSHAYYVPVTKIIGALAHNEGGLKMVKEKQLIEMLFSCMLENIANMKDSIPLIGAVLDGITADHTELRTIIVRQAIFYLQSLPTRTHALLGDAETKKDSFYVGRATEYYEGIPAHEIVPTFTTDAYYFVDQAVGFLEALSKNHLTRAELISQHAVDAIVLLCDMDGLPFDFAYTKVGTGLGKVLRALFTLDIDTESFENIFCNLLWNSFENLRPALNKFQRGMTDEQRYEYLVSLSRFNSYLHLFFQMVFFEYGTGYRVILFMEKIVKTSLGDDTLMSRISEILRYAIWDDTAAVTAVQEPYSTASRVISIDGHGVRSEDVKETKAAVEKAEKILLGSTVTDNFKSLRACRYLGSSTSSIISKVFLEFSNACCHDRTLQPTRWTDANIEKRKSGIRMAESLAVGLNKLLDSVVTDSRLSFHVRLQYLISAISVIKRILVKFNNYDYPVVLLGIVVQFKQIGGIMRLMDIWENLWGSSLLEKDVSSLSAEEKWNREALLNASEALISLITMMATSEMLLGTKKVVFALEGPGPNESPESNPNRFSASQFLVEVKLMIIKPFQRLWEGEKVLHTNSKICSSMIELSKKLFSTSGEPMSSPDKTLLPRNLDWRRLTPSQEKVSILVRYGADENAASRALIDTGDDLEAAFAILPQENDYNFTLSSNIGLCPVDSQSGERLVTREDLDLVRSTWRKNIAEPFVQLCTAFHECIYPVADFLLRHNSGSLDYMDDSNVDPERNLLDRLIFSLKSGLEKEICASSHLLGILANDSDFFAEFYGDFLKLTDHLIELLSYQHSFEHSWYPNILLLTEKIVTFTDIPVKETPKTRAFLSHYEIRSRATSEPDFSKKVFFLIKIPNPHRLDVTALSLARLYAHYARVPSYAMELFESGATLHLVKSLYTFIGSPIIKNLQNTVTILLRLTVETPDLLKKYMKVVVKHTFAFQTKLQMESMLKTNSRAYARSPRTFISAVTDYCYYTDDRSTLMIGTKEAVEKKKKKLLTYLETSGEEEEESEGDEKVEDTLMTDEPQISKPNLTENVTGVIGMLVDELYSCPMYKILSENEEETADKNKEQPEEKDHKEFVYVTYLFQMLSELLQSYNSCKIEFLNHQWRVGGFKSTKKEPALSYLLTTYLPDNGRTSKRNMVSTTNVAFMAKKQSALSTMAKNVVICLGSATGELGHEIMIKEVYGEPALAYVRKLLIDSLISYLKEKETHVNVFAKNLRGLHALFELSYELLNHKNFFYHTDEVDGANIAIVMFEKKLASKVSDLMSHLDLNHPDTPDVVRSGLRLLLGLSRTSMDVDSLPNSAELELQEVDVYDEDDREETPNIFRNSTLGMYDTEDMFEEEEEVLDDDEVIEEEEDHHPNADDMYYEEVESDAYSDVEESDGDLSDETGSDDSDESVEFVVERVVDSDDDEDMIYGDNVSEDGFSSGSSFMYDFDEYEESSDDHENMTEIVRQLADRRPVRYDHRGRQAENENDNLLAIQGPGEVRFPDGEVDAEVEAEAEAELLAEEEDEIRESDLDDDSTENSEFSGVYFELNNMSGRVRADRAFLSLLEDMDPDPNVMRNPLLPDRRNARNERDHGLLYSDQDRHPDRLPMLSGETSTADQKIDYRDVYLETTINTPSVRRRHTEGKIGELILSIMKPEYKSIVPRWQDLLSMFDEYNSQDIQDLIKTGICNRLYPESMKQLKEINDLEEKVKELKGMKAREKEEKEKEEESRKQAEKKEKEKNDDVEMQEVHETDAEDSDKEPAIVSVGGRDINVTPIGIDPTFLEALPDDIREEALTQHLREMLATGRANGEASSQVLDPEFLQALPESVLEELDLDILRGNNLADDIAQAEAIGNSALESDVINFWASLDRPLRHTLLLEQDDETLSQLPSRLAGQAYGIRNHVDFSERPVGDRVLGEHGIRMSFSEEEGIEHDGHLSNRHRKKDNSTNKKGKQQISASHLSLIPKNGIASLIRLLYLPQTARQREYLNELLLNLCNNKHSRNDILNFLLHIIQDGSSDKHSVEKGFVAVTNRSSLTPSTPVRTGTGSSGTTVSRNPATPKSTSKLINSNPSMTLNDAVSPVVITQQVLEALEYLVRYSGIVKMFFLSEHDLTLSTKKQKAIKEKGKDKEMLESRYPINILFSLLDRKIVLYNSFTLELLSALIQEVTRDLPLLLKGKTKESKNKGKSKMTEKTGETNNVKGETSKTESSNGDETEMNKDQAEPESSDSSKSFTLPVIPTKNLKKICGILTEKECSSRTFQQILDVIHNLSAVPSIADLIGQELVAEVTRLGPVIVSDLKELLRNLSHVNRGLDVQGNILNKFCSGGADQVKLLRLLTAIDYLFVPESESDTAKSDEGEKLLKSLYEQMTFGSLWGSLSDCLDFIQERKDMIHVATALLPTVEALMVFCKHSPVKDVQLRDRERKELHPVYEYKRSDIANEPLESLFFSFTDQHRKILNQMIRNNPKLMSGSFSILFKNPRSLDFDNKRRFFYRRIYNPQTHSLNTISLNVRRDHVFLDSYKALYFKTADEIKNSRLNIRFQGEEGIDAGGVTREWFQSLSRQMMNPDYALFTPVASDRTSFHPNRTSWVNPEHLSFFKFIGRIIGKAIYDYKLLDCHFSRPVYRKVLGKSVSIKDMEALDLDYYKSLMWMLENDITDVITETFSIEAEDYGEQKIIDLKPGGRNIAVTQENKQEYVKLVVEYRLIKSVQEQMDHFLEGFHDIIPKDVVAIFDEQELELLISGMPDIDTEDWRNNTEYNNYSASSPQVKWFWRAVKSFDAEEKAKLLQFATGTSKVPLNGFAKLEGMNDITKFSIHRDFGGKNRLPSSHTCFNQVDLPEYDSYEELRQALLTAITEGREGFGLV